MKCPYCGGVDNFDNSNINHKFYHKDCKRYFKFCPTCNTTYKQIIDKENSKQDNVVSIENLFKIDFCNNCSRSWLPDFPTSWTRSFTNIAKMFEVLNDLSNIASDSITTENLFTIQRTHNGVIFNPLRAKSRGIEKYISGSGKRRMNEYLNIFRNAQILLHKVDNDEYIREISKFGEEFLSSKNNIEIIAYFISSFANIKLNNGYQRPQKNSVYQFFKIRFMENILEVAHKKTMESKTASIYDFGLSILARNKEQFEDYSLKYMNNFGDSALNSIFFNDSNLELNSRIKTSFINVFESLGLLEEEENNYKITNLGIDILENLKSKPAIWYEDLIEINNNERNVLMAKILIWRMVKHDLLNKTDLKEDFNNLERSLSDDLKIDLQNTDDLHLNLYYDEPLYSAKVCETDIIVDEIKKFIKDGNITKIEINEYCETLPILWYSDILNIVTKHEEHILNKINLLDSTTFKATVQSGSKWHKSTKEMFNRMGLDCVDYKSKPLFNDIIIDKLNINLPGGTVHNPDMLIMESGYGPKDCILVDSKDENSINSEVHKLIGYNSYAIDKRVQTYCIIALRGTLPEITQTRINQNIEEFDRITIIEQKALEYLAEEKKSKSDLLNILQPSKGFKHITYNKLVSNNIPI